MSPIKVFLVDDQLGTNDALANVVFGRCTIVSVDVNDGDNPVQVIRHSGQVRDGNRVSNDVSALLSALDQYVSVGELALVLLDMRFDSGIMDQSGVPSGSPGDERFGEVLLDAISAQHPDLPIVFISTYAQADIGGEALRYLAKSDITDHTLSLCLLRHGKLGTGQRRKLLRLQDEIVVSDGLVAAYISAFEIAPLSIPLLITGETGSGKDVLAQYAHKQSGRNEKPFIAINVNAIPRDLFESTLFGHERGSFTGASEAKPGLFELADGGSLFLDEIGDLPFDLQVKLLRVLETGQVRRVGGRSEINVDVRLMAATNRVNAQGGVEGLRDDLKFRISGQTIYIPPLRERREDIIPLAQKMRDGACEEFKKEGVSFGESAILALQQYDFLGNARELLHRVRSAVARTGNHSLITAQTLGLDADVLFGRRGNKATSRETVRAANTVLQSHSPMRDWLMQACSIRAPATKSELYGLKAALDEVVMRLNRDLALAALEATRQTMSNDLVPTTAMQMISGDSELKGTKPKRLLAQMLGRVQDEPLENDQLNALIAAWREADGKAD